MSIIDGRIQRSGGGGGSAVTTSDLLGDTFGAGDYTFPDDVFVQDALAVGHGTLLNSARHSGNGGTEIAQFQMIGTDAEIADATFVIGVWSNTATAGGSIVFVKSANGTIGSSTVVEDNELLGTIAFAADDGTDFNTVPASIKARVDDASPTGSSIGGELVFSVALGAGADDITEAFLIRSDLGTEFAGEMTIGALGDVRNGTLHVLASANTSIRMEATGESANEKTWRVGIFGATLQFQANADDYLTGNIWMQVNRTGIVVDDIILTAATVELAARVGIGGIGTSPSTACLYSGSSTSVSSLRITHGAAPSSPVNGDMWTTTAGLFVRINGSTIGPLAA